MRLHGEHPDKKILKHAATVRHVLHPHEFGAANPENEKKTLRVIILTAVTMAAEIIAGALTGSMALLADGWHMGTHAFSLGITYFAYVMARRFAGSPRFGFGTGKFGILSAYTSALFLAATALYMMVESVRRFIDPVAIAFDEAVIVAVIGLAVNVLSIRMLGDSHGHFHGHGRGQGNGHVEFSDHHHDIDHDHDDHHASGHVHSHGGVEHAANGHVHDHSAGGHEHDHLSAEHNHSTDPNHPVATQDHNLRAAYLHVVADALTSVLAILALVAGKYLGWSFLDPAMGIVGGILIARWSWGLLRSSALILLDGNADADVRSAITGAIESDGDSVVGDLHVWPLGSDALAAAITIVAKESRTPSEYGARLARIPRLKHTTIEIRPCMDQSCECGERLP